MTEFLDQYQAWEAEKLEKYGWIVHFVVGNAHTHGLAEISQHPDFQIVINLAPETAHGIFSNLVDLVKGGTRFRAGETIEEIIGGGYKVKLINARETGRDVLRVILPDPVGNLDEETVTGIYKEQYDVAEEMEAN